MTLTRENIADRIQKKFGLYHFLAKQLTDAFFEFITGSLERGEEVKLTGFGNFTLRDKPARPGRNPKKGQEVEVSARRVTTFKIGHKFKQRIQK